MRADSYTRVVLTVIALCLIYLCVRDTSPPVLAQAAPTRVVITGVALEQGVTRNVLPVGVIGELRMAAEGFSAVPVQPVQVRVDHAVEVRASRPLKIEADQPLLVRAVREPGSQRPGPNP